LKIIDSIYEIPLDIWHQKIGKPFWKEFHYDYLLFLQNENNGLFKFIEFKEVIIPFYINNEKQSEFAKNLMNPLLNIMLEILEINNNNVSILFFVSDSFNNINEELIKNYIIKTKQYLINIYSNNSTNTNIITFCDEENKCIKVLQVISKKMIVGSYNTYIKNIFSNMNDFEIFLGLKIRRKIRR